MQQLRDTMLDAPQSIDEQRLPPRFGEAQELLREAISRTAQAGISDETLTAVLISEAMPRLVGAYGPDHCARILAMFARCIAEGAGPYGTRQ